MDETGLLEYVKASARLMGLTLDEARAQRVADHLQRTVAMARLLDQVAPGVSDEPAEIYRPGRRPSALSRQGG